jgi:glycosyltransferase involved in cell wall biosynthesis
VTDDISQASRAKGEAARPGTSSSHPCVSLIIPVYNGEQTIARCLDAVFAQEVDFDYEVIVADSSTDATPRIIADKFPAVRYVRLEKRAYPGTARNAAIRSARAELVAMTDADCIVEPDFLARIVAGHASGEFDAIGGAICNGTPESPSGTIGYLLEFREFIPDAPRREVVTIPTANISYRRAVFEQLGYFDDVRASEDLLFNWRLTLAGGRILFDPAIRVTHLNRTGWRKIVAYQSILGRGSAAARRMMNPPFEVIRTYPALGWLVPYLMKHPWLGLFIPPVRFLRAITWLLRYDPRTALTLLVFSPLYLVGAFNWSRAFVLALRAIHGPPPSPHRTQAVGGDP